MSDKKKAKQRTTDEETITKEEYAVAKYLRFGLPAKEGKLHGMEVKCFIANAAIDKLLDSKWSSSKNKTDAIFTNRASCITYMDMLLQKGLFHRADRDKRKKDKDSTKKKKKDKDTEKEEPSGEDELRQRKSKKDKKSKKEKEEQLSIEKSKDKADEPEKKDEKKKEEKKKKERRLKLLMSDDQWFEEGDEVYVWIYDPVNIKSFLIGLLMVLGAIGLCMFPLWPEEVRIGVYYLSLAAASFVGFILFLAVVRLILFCCVWALTMGRYHFWFLPNLTEDVGFFDSFRPLYHHDFVSQEEESDSDSKKKKKKKSDSKAEKSDTKDQTEKSSDKDDSDEFEVIKKEDLDENKGETVEEEDENNENNDEEEDEEDDGEDDLNDEESEDIEDDDAQNNSGSEKEDKKTQ